MDYYQIIISLLGVAASVLTAYVTIKTHIATMSERVQNIKEDLEKQKDTFNDEIYKVRSELTNSITRCQSDSSDKISVAMDYIKRVEANKADKSEVNLVIDATKRIEQKLDLLIMREGK